MTFESANVLAIDSSSAKKYLCSRKEEADKLVNDIKSTKGNLHYARITRFSEESKTVMVNGEWCDDIYCALAYILRKWW